MEKPNFIDQELNELARLSLENEKGALTKDEKMLLSRRLTTHAVYLEKIQSIVKELRNKHN